MKRLATSFSLFLALFLLALLAQWQGGAYTSGHGEHPDEPAHVVTGLMVRDWAAAGFPSPAMRFAADYYLHYPRVALGHWPPVFYGVQAAWTLVAPPSRTALLILMACLTAILCLRTAQAIGRFAPGAAGPMGAILLLTAAPVLAHSRMIMAEILLCWLGLEAILAFAAWMEAPGWRRAAWFVFWATAALLTKVTAIWLAPVPLLAIAMSGRWKLLREESLWVAGLAVAGLVLPWYLLAPGALHQASPDHLGIVKSAELGSAARMTRRMSRTLAMFPLLFSWLGPVLLMAAWGGRELWKRGNLLAPTVAGLAVGMMAMRFSVLATAFEDRTVLPLVAPLILCAAAGVPAMLRTPMVSVAALGLFATWGVLSTPARGSRSVESAVSVCQRQEYRDAAVLIAARFTEEGSFVSELALSDPRRPGHYVFRGSKVLAESTWTGGRYRLRVESQAEVMALIGSIPVGLIAIESDPRRWGRLAHLRLLAATMAAHRQRFRLIHSGPLLVYEVLGYRDRPRAPVTMYLHGLGRSIGTGEDGGIR